MAVFDKRDWKQPFFDGLCPTATDWAMMAAYIDGEGSILINPRRKRVRDGVAKDIACTFYLKLTVANTDVRLVAWCKERFGGTFKDANTRSYYEGRNVKTAWHWSASSNRAAWILHNCLPHFVIKGEQALIGIQLQESMRLSIGSRSLPKEVVETRRGLKRQLLVLKAKGRALDAVEQRQFEEVA